MLKDLNLLSEVLDVIDKCNALFKRINAQINRIREELLKAELMSQEIARCLAHKKRWQEWSKRVYMHQIAFDPFNISFTY